MRRVASGVSIPDTVGRGIDDSSPRQTTTRAEGFEWQGDVFPSLSAVAKAITGSHTSGFLFFGLDGKGGRA
jgi:hypothetical protein